MAIGEGPPSREASDLLREFRETGRQEPFEEIVRRYATMVYHLCFQILKNNHDAEDATQAVFLTLAVKSKTTREIKAVGPWLQQVAYRMSLDMIRSKKRRRRREEAHYENNGGEAHMPDASSRAGADELKRVVGEELNRLPPKYRLPLILFYFGGLSREEMANELRVKASTLGVRLHRGRAMLGTRLAERGVILAEGVMAVAMVGLVNVAVTDSMISATSFAAARLATGTDIYAGLVSARVMALAKGAGSAAMLAKCKILAAALAIAGTAVAGGAQVVGKVRSLDLRLPNLLEMPQRLLPKFQVPEPKRFVRQDTGTIDAIPAVEEKTPVGARPIGRGMMPFTWSRSGQVETQLGDYASPLMRSDSVAAHMPMASRQGIGPAADRSLLPGFVPGPLGAGGGRMAPARSRSGEFSALPAHARSGNWPRERNHSVVPEVPNVPGGPTEVVDSGSTPSSQTPLVLAMTPMAALSMTSLSNDLHSSIAYNGAADDGPAALGVYPFAGVEAAVVMPPVQGELAMVPPTARRIGSSVLRGYGKVAASVLLEPGQVIADGGVLDMSSVTTLSSNIENPAEGGVNGWYAVNRGKLMLAPLDVPAGTPRSVWGENPADPQIDLVNSVELLYKPPPSDDGTVAISLVAPDFPGIPGFTAQGRNHVLAMYSVEAEGLAMDTVEFGVRYDSVLEDALAESPLRSLKMYGYDGQWRVVRDSLQILSDQNMIYGRPGDVDLIAVVLSEGQGAIGTGMMPIPEPAGVLLVAAAGATLLRRRRRA